MKKVGNSKYYSIAEPWPDGLLERVKVDEDKVLAIFNEISYNIIKVSKDSISFLLYPDLSFVPHPELTISVSVNNNGVTRKIFESNQPILHRCELFLPNHPEKNKWAELTKQEEEAGLFENPNIIGYKTQWEQLLRLKGLCVSNFKLNKNPMRKYEDINVGDIIDWYDPRTGVWYKSEVLEKTTEQHEDTTHELAPGGLLISFNFSKQNINKEPEHFPMDGGYYITYSLDSLMWGLFGDI